MKAQCILVFYVPGQMDNGEAKKGAKALFNRLADQKKARHLRLVEVPPFSVSHTALPRARTRNEIATHTEPGTAIYIIAHHAEIDLFSPPEFGGVTAANFAGIVNDYVRDGDLPLPVTKVALLACNGAVDLLKYDGTSILRRFCSALAALGHHPKIAGWDCFVSVCFEKNPRIHGTAKYPEHAGKKVIGPQKRRPNLPQDRVDHKKIVQWEGSAIVTRDLAGWTQAGK